MERLIEKIGYYVAKYEGWEVDGSTAKRNNNPGNLKNSPLMRSKDAKGFVIFNSPKEGIAQLYHQIALDISRGLTLKGFLTKYAPPNENATDRYVKFVAKGVGIDADKPLLEYIEFGL